MPRGNYRPGVVASTKGMPEAQWLEYRRGGIGGSDLPILLGCSTFATARDLYYDKLNIKPVIDDDENNWLQKEIGHRLEPVAAKLFYRETGLRVRKVERMFYHPWYPWMIADVDFLIVLDDGRYGILEIKTSHLRNKTEWANGSYPFKFEMQCRHYMCVLNLDFVYLVVLFSNSAADSEIRFISRDYHIEDQIMKKEAAFWHNHILKRIPPAYTERGDLVERSIRKHYGFPEQSRPIVQLRRQDIGLLGELAALKQQREALGRQYRKLDKEIKRKAAPLLDQLGQSCKGRIVLPNQERIILDQTPTTRELIPKDKLEHLKIHHPDIYREYVEVRKSTKLQITKEGA